MDILTSMFYMSITLLVECQVFTFILIGVIIRHSVKQDWRRLNKTIFSYLVSIALVIGLPYGYIKISHPEVTGAEKKVLEEVEEWIS
jgi:hypothetical protein